MYVIDIDGKAREVVYAHGDLLYPAPPDPMDLRPRGYARALRVYLSAEVTRYGVAFKLAERWSKAYLKCHTEALLTTLSVSSADTRVLSGQVHFGKETWEKGHRSPPPRMDGTVWCVVSMWAQVLLCARFRLLVVLSSIYNRTLTCVRTSPTHQTVSDAMPAISRIVDRHEKVVESPWSQHSPPSPHHPYVYIYIPSCSLCIYYTYILSYAGGSSQIFSSYGDKN